MLWILQITRDLSENQDIEEESDKFQHNVFDSLTYDTGIFNMVNNAMVETGCYDKYCSKPMNILLKISCLSINCDVNQKKIKKLAKNSRQWLDELKSEVAKLNTAASEKGTSNMEADYDSSDVPKMVGKKRHIDVIAQCIQTYCGNTVSDKQSCILNRCSHI
jgi:hypothetical protein